MGMDIRVIGEKYKVNALLLFGSRAKNEPLNKESDFDVCYLADQSLDFTTETELITDLMPYFHSDKVDLCNFRRADPLLKYLIMKDYQVLYLKPGYSMAPIEVYAEHLYKDNRIIFEARAAYLADKLSVITPS